MDMSLYHQNFVLYGYYIPYDKYETDLKFSKFDKEFNVSINNPSEGDIAIISDDENKQYCYVGLVQFVSETSDESKPFPPYKIDEPEDDDLFLLTMITRKMDISFYGGLNHHVLTHIS